MQGDALGPISTPSIIDGTNTELSLIDYATDYSFSCTVSSQTTLAWIQFLSMCVLISKTQFQVEVQCIRLDRAPMLTANCADLNKESIRSALLKLGTLVEFAARNRPQGIAKCEGSHDPITRAAEAMLRRSQRGRAFFLGARAYARLIRQRRTARNATKPRYTLYTGLEIDLSDPTFFLFACRAPVLYTESERGLKGGLGRADIGVFVGIDKGQYLLILPGGHLVHQPDLKPTDEHLLLARGLTPTSALRNISTQTGEDARPPPDLDEQLALLRGDELREDAVGPPSARVGARLRTAPAKSSAPAPANSSAPAPAPSRKVVHYPSDPESPPVPAGRGKGSDMPH